MSPAASWALVLAWVLCIAWLWRWLARGPTPELRSPLVYLTPCPGHRCPWLLARGEACPEHGPITDPNEPIDLWPAGPAS